MNKGVLIVKLGVSEEKFGVFDEMAMGVSDCTPMMMISSQTPEN